MEEQDKRERILVWVKIKDKYILTNKTVYRKSRRKSFVKEKESHKDKYNEEKQEKEAKVGQ